MKSDYIIVHNTVNLFILNVAKLLFSLVTLPYLTHVLSVNYFGVTTYVRSCMNYVQVIVDFGFILSATKSIVRAKDDKDILGSIVGTVFAAKMLLAICSLVVIFIMMINLKLLHGFWLFTILSFVAVVLNCLLPDFLFRGLDEMHILSYRFVVCKAITTGLTFVFVKSDDQILLIPIFDMIGSALAVVLTQMEMHNRNIIIRFDGWRKVLYELIVSGMYFASSFATTTFNVMNTLLIGIYLGAEEVAFWGVTMQLIFAAQSLYSPITEGVYTKMIFSKDIHLIRNILLIFMPLIFLASIMCYFQAENILVIISGAKYVEAGKVFRWLLPVLILSFPAMLLGWSTLGAIDKVKQTTGSTIVAITVQIIFVALLIVSKNFTLRNVAIMRCLAEFTLFATRAVCCWRYRKEFLLQKDLNQLNQVNEMK